jgi:hypothetical protein
VALSGALLLLAAAPALALASDAMVSVGSPPDQTPRNVQYDPAVAIDPSHPNVVVAGWTDHVDRRSCPQVDAREFARCLRAPEDNPPVAHGSAVGFSFDGGASWIQPTYTGLTGSDCDPTTTCEPHVGQIHTLPWYYENDLVSWVDQAVAIGPVPVDGRFSWANGSRVYYANTTAAAPDPYALPNPEFRGDLAIAVSRLDNPTLESVLDKASWQPPVLVSTRHGQEGFPWKARIWADNAASSPFFGSVYECHADFRSNGGGNGLPDASYASFSRDGGETWTTKQVDSADSNGHSQNLWGPLGCTIRTDSRGVVYMFNVRPENPELVPAPRSAELIMYKSFDGGRSWTKPRVVERGTDPYFVDPVSGSMVTSGYAGAKTDFGTAPSIDIANGAPTGAGATDEIVLAWADNGGDVNANTMQLAWSQDRGNNWNGPTTVSLPGDRPLYAATAISPTGDRVYAVYEAVTSPWRGNDMTSPRPYHGVFLTAPLAANGAPGAWSTVYSGSTDTSAGHNDERGTYLGRDFYQPRVGYFVSAAASRTYGVGVWTDARNATVCDAMQDWRAGSLAAGQLVFPAPWPLADCPATFGNADIWSATTG